MGQAIQIDHRLRHQEVELLRGAMGELGSRLRLVAFDALLQTCQELRLPEPTLPPQPDDVVLSGIASGRSGDIQDWYGDRREAEATLVSILRDEPEFDGELWVEAVEFEMRPN